MLAEVARRLDLVEDWLAQLCADRIFATAGQLAIWWGSEVIELTCGTGHTGRDLEASDVTEVFCLTKPVVAAAALLVAEGEGRSPHEALRSILPDLHRSVGDDITLASLINHTARMKAPPALQWMLAPVVRRPTYRDLVPESGGLRCYSEVSAWVLLVAAMEALAGCSAEEYVRSQVLTPLDIADEVLISPGSVAEAAAAGRVFVVRAGLPIESIPMLHVYAPGYQRGVSAAFGGMASARATGRFVASLATQATGGDLEGLPSVRVLRAVLEAAPPPAFDATWRRSRAFGLAFEQVGASFDGQPAGLWQLSSFLSMATVVADPERSIGFCLTLDGGSLGPSVLDLCRSSVLGLLGYDLAATETGR